ncbi:MAG: hypothetical protein K2O91_25405 [Lachnospiraceae bacterium]|nr:hypothetical protein [Lachnospiraceae bacterium]
MRLIDADSFKQLVTVVSIASGHDTGFISEFCKLIDSQPTAYDVDKVIDRINNMFKHHRATKTVQRLVVETIGAEVINKDLEN